MIALAALNFFIASRSLASVKPAPPAAIFWADGRLTVPVPVSPV